MWDDTTSYGSEKDNDLPRVMQWAGLRLAPSATKFTWHSAAEGEGSVHGCWSQRPVVATGSAYYVLHPQLSHLWSRCRGYI